MTGPHDPNQPDPPRDGDEPQYRPEQYRPEQYPAQPYPGQPYPGQPYPGQQYPPEQYPQQYPQQPYPGQQSPQQPYGYPPQPTAQVGLLERLGPRAVRRAQPRLGVTLGGVGVGLVVVGVLIWSFTYLIEGLFAEISSESSGGPDDSRRFLGAALGAIVTVAGYVLVVKARSGALRTAGVAASALGVPVTMEFLSLSFTSGSPINLDAVFWVTVLVYLASYLFVPGARGHTFYLGLALLQTWGYIVGKIGDNLLTSATTTGLRAALPGSASSPFSAPDTDTTTIGTTSLIIGLVYYAAAFLLDRRGRHGIAVTFVVAGIPAVALGIGGLAPDLDLVGTGIFLVVIGFALATYGAMFERRFTTWFWAVAGASGFVVILAKIADTGTSAGISLIVIGIVVVLAGWRVGPLLHETPDIDEGVAAPAPAAPRQH